jgi:hypothetical protein
MRWSDFRPGLGKLYLGLLVVATIEIICKQIYCYLASALLSLIVFEFNMYLIIASTLLKPAQCRPMADQCPAKSTSQSSAEEKYECGIMTLEVAQICSYIVTILTSVLVSYYLVLCKPSEPSQ